MMSRRWFGLGVAILWALLGGSVRADLVTYWSFDADTRTIDGDSITGFADLAGDHDATVGNGVFAASDSVDGPLGFGEAIRFNGDNNLQFNNLTELMQSSGAPSYTISMWVRWLNETPPGGPTPFSTLSSWGNAGAGTPNETSRFSYAFGPNGANTIRGQSRHESDSASGTDIFAQTTDVSPGEIIDGDWHMLSWTFDTTSGELNTYFDGMLADTLTSGAASFEMADSTSTFGTLGLKGDTGDFLPADTHLDDIRVYNEVLSLIEINDLMMPGDVPTMGDFNGDGTVDNADFMVLSGNLGAHLDRGVSRSDGDINIDGRIDLDDFGEFKTLFPGASGRAAAIPEPSSIAIVTCALAAIALGCIRKLR